MDKKGSVRDVLLIGILIFVFGIGFFIIFFMSNTVITAMLSMPAINSSAATVAALQGSQNVTHQMDYVIFGLFIGLILALLISGWFIGANPIFMVIYFLVIVMAVIFGSMMSNVWETTTQSSIFGTTINSFPITNNLLTNLPIYIAIIGFLGMIVMFAKPYLSGGYSGGGGEY